MSELTTEEQLVERLRSAKANGDPAKYVAFLTVKEAHAAASLIESLQSRLTAAERERDEARTHVQALANLAEDLADQQAMPDRSHEAVLLAGFAFLARTEPAEAALAARAPDARPGEDYYEDMGYVLWWRFPIEEPPYVGTPNDSDWPGYHTHFTPFAMPTRAALAARAPDAGKLREALEWIEQFAAMRSEDDRATLAFVARGALRTISERARAALASLSVEKPKPSSPPPDYSETWDDLDEDVQSLMDRDRE